MPGNSVTLPVTFSWGTRYVATDYYRIGFINPNTYNLLCIGSYQTSNWFAFDSTSFSSCSFSYGVTYGWVVYVYKGNTWTNGYGESYYLYPFSFRSAAYGVASRTSVNVAVPSDTNRPQLPAR